MVNCGDLWGFCSNEEQQKGNNNTIAFFVSNDHMKINHSCEPEMVSIAPENEHISVIILFYLHFSLVQFFYFLQTLFSIHIHT